MISIREDSQGRELWRSAWTAGDVPEVGAEIERSTLDGRWWAVVEIERADARVAIHLRKKGDPSPDPQHVGHHVTVPPLRALAP